jgi:broad specificity phosphatase PhoE
MKRLFYVRHGETHMNVSQRLSGQIETPLTDNGIKQAEQTGKDIKTKLPKIDLIVCSPYERAYHTAKLIAEQIGYPVSNIEKSDLLIERTFGPLEGTSATEFLDNHDYSDFDDVEGAETVEDLQNRAATALEYIKSLDQYDNILIVGHGAFGRAIKRVVNSLPYTHEYKQDKETKTIGNGEIVELI